MKIAKQLSVAVVALALFASACSNEPKTASELYDAVAEAVSDTLVDGMSTTELKESCERKLFLATIGYNAVLERFETDGITSAEKTQRDMDDGTLTKEAGEAWLALLNSGYEVKNERLATALTTQAFDILCDTLKPNR